MASMDTWTMVQLRAECARLGITPGRGKAETVTRIMEARAKAARRAEVAESAAANLKRQARGSGIAERHAAELAEVHARIGGPIMGELVTTPGAERAANFAEAPENLTPEEEQAEREAMAEYSAEMRRMDDMGEAAWMAARKPAPRMSRLARALCASTALGTMLAVWPGIYRGGK